MGKEITPTLIHSRVYLNQIKSEMLTCEEIRDIFERNDQGKKGYLVKEELGSTMRMLGNSHLGDEDLDKFMVVINKTQDGRVSFQQFRSFLGFDG